VEVYNSKHRFRTGQRQGQVRGQEARNVDGWRVAIRISPDTVGAGVTEIEAEECGRSAGGQYEPGGPRFWEEGRRRVLHRKYFLLTFTERLSGMREGFSKRNVLLTFGNGPEATKSIR